MQTCDIIESWKWGHFCEPPGTREKRDTMPVIYDKLFKILNERGHSSTYWLRQNGFHSATVTKLRKNQTVNSDTIGAICKLLNCQPGDIMEYAEEYAE